MIAHRHDLDRDCALLLTESPANAALRCRSSDPTGPSSTPQNHRRAQKQPRMSAGLGFAVALLAAAAPAAMAQNCISLAGSTACPAFNASSISTSTNITGLLYVLRLPSVFTTWQKANILCSPFLKYVSDRDSFDAQIWRYVSSDYAQQKYVGRLGL
jgi:hypothetical protein